MTATPPPDEPSARFLRLLWLLLALCLLCLACGVMAGLGVSDWALPDVG